MILEKRQPYYTYKFLVSIPKFDERKKLRDNMQAAEFKATIEEVILEKTESS